MSPNDYLEAARVPSSVQPQQFGLWTIERREGNQLLKAANLFDVGWPDYTLLFRMSEAMMHEPPGEIVMEDSLPELQRHLPIWLAAYGRVLVTGLGLGCVVRGLLAKPEVDHVDVIEIDPQIIERIGPEFAGNKRVTITLGDALKMQWTEPCKWDFAWHDIWLDAPSIELHMAHVNLLNKFRYRIQHQGAWLLPRMIKRLWPRPLLG